ncbi:hypothetical protein AG1IA_10216 [Rhizoctonia solani AG-1 IA]|uniref:Uncharacterized protein n=1 Tax=Thanatephorus cucumeris (strain AG1-IA) TaxID=983506 RepID=L8WHA6_THACA|nr:hypothetical protein AG1IA_10216 [Rhizoctonia solani AG-1 IA]
MQYAPQFINETRIATRPGSAPTRRDLLSTNLLDLNKRVLFTPPTHNASIYAIQVASTVDAVSDLTRDWLLRLSRVTLAQEFISIIHPVNTLLSKLFILRPKMTMLRKAMQLSIVNSRLATLSTPCIHSNDRSESHIQRKIWKRIVSG